MRCIICENEMRIIGRAHKRFWLFGAMAGPTYACFGCGIGYQAEYVTLERIMGAKAILDINGCYGEEIIKPCKYTAKELRRVLNLKAFL